MQLQGWSKEIWSTKWLESLADLLGKIKDTF